MDPLEEFLKEEATQHVNLNDSDLNMGTLYDVNKQMVAQGKPMSRSKINDKKFELQNWFNWKIDSYAMLLCRQRNDYTVFHLYEKQNPNPPKLAAQECIGCLQDRGQIMDMILQKDDAWEMWVRIDGEAYAYYLFCYDKAVIEV